MTILMLAMLAPVCGFYVYALVNFQKEIRRLKKHNVVAGQPNLNLAAAPGQSVYPSESTYWGPLVVIPITGPRSTAHSAT